MADPMVRQIERACDDARRAWDAPGVMRVGSEPKVTLHESVLRRALLLLEKAERERDEARRLLKLAYPYLDGIEQAQAAEDDRHGTDASGDALERIRGIRQAISGILEGRPWTT